MKITNITATTEKILLTLDESAAGSAVLCARVPLVNGTQRGEGFASGRTVLRIEQPADGAQLAMPRFAEDYDLLTCRFELALNGEAVPGVCYVTDFSEDFSRMNDPYPATERPIGTWCNALEEDVDGMRFGYMMNELDMIWLMKREPEDGDFVHVFNGEEY